MDYKVFCKLNFKKSLLIDIDNQNMIDIYNYGYFVYTISINECKKRYNLTDKHIKLILNSDD